MFDDKKVDFVVWVILDQWASQKFSHSHSQNHLKNSDSNLWISDLKQVVVEAFGFVRPTWGHPCQTRRHTEWIVHPTVDKTGTCKLKFVHIRSIFELLVTLSFTNHLYMCACEKQKYTINLEILRIFRIVWMKGRLQILHINFSLLTMRSTA